MKKELIKLIRLYNNNEEEIKKIEMAYDYAEHAHEGMYRDSGEPYITHPVAVAVMLIERHADADTICAALLHDTLEDTKATKEEIADLFGSEVAKLVDGVTKITNFNNKTSDNRATKRKLITSINADVRIIIIKLLDRLHNMKTLSYKSLESQKRNAMETLEIYTHIANYLGEYEIKEQLEDLCLSFLKRDEYLKIKEELERIKLDSTGSLKEMYDTITYILTSNDIPCEIKYRVKNIYDIYQKVSKGGKIIDIHNLLALRIILNRSLECYMAMGLIHQQYHPLTGLFKDYICSPKKNGYKSIHTTVFGPNETLVQARIRTKEMDLINNYGLSSFWFTKGNEASSEMQSTLMREFQFIKSLSEIDHECLDDIEFERQIKKDLFSGNIYVCTPNGEVIELPIESNSIDFAYHIHTDLGNKIIRAIVNGEEISIFTPLKDNDIVKIITDENSLGPHIGWINKVHTITAKRKIKEFGK